MKSKKALSVITALLLMLSTISLSAIAVVKSTNPKDPYTLRYSRLGTGRTVLELCGPKGCRALGPIQLDLDKEEIESLRKKEKFFYYTNEAAGPVLMITLPLAGAARAGISAKFTMKIAEKYVPFVTNKLFEKFGKGVVVKTVYGGMMAMNTIEGASMGYEIADEFLNADENEAALAALSDRALRGEEVHVDFSIEQLAKHLEADLIESQRAKEASEEEQPFGWPM